MCASIRVSTYLTFSSDCRFLVRRHTQIYPGYDGITARQPLFGRSLRLLTYTLEQTPMTIFGISHFLVLEKVEAALAR